MSERYNFPRQLLPSGKKTLTWGKQCVDWGANKTFSSYSPVRNSVMHKKINYDLLGGKIHMSDIERLVNPEAIDSNGIPDRIQHYPIINPKLGVLRGEESRRVFDFKVVVTNPNAVSEIEENKKLQVMGALQQLIESSAQGDEQTYNSKLEELNNYYTYHWQDLRELRCNELLNHYMKEYNIPLLFNEGFVDAMTVGEEIYLCDIVGGEPVIEKIDPLKIRTFRSGYSNKIEDADVVILEDYWSPGRVLDVFYEQLSAKDIKYLEDRNGTDSGEDPWSDDTRKEFVPAASIMEDVPTGDMFFSTVGQEIEGSLIPFDIAGNVRVCRVYWKSKRKIKKVKSYDPETGEPVYDFYPEDYICNTDLGEEEQTFWINQAWEGTKIGDNIYVNIRPRVIQFNRLSDPSRCHFGIVGSIYNVNGSKPFSLVDMMKPFSYMYDIIHDRLNKMMARNWGILLELDLAKVPKGWEIDKWLYYAQHTGLIVKDSFKEGTVGAATGKIAGALNNASSVAINADWGNNIQMYINLLEYIKGEMAECVGISKQREGQVSNRETVGGVERATLQSSHITEQWFLIHDDVKKRAIECFLEVAKAAMRGKNKKFQYITSDFSQKITEIDGDEFAECDYGLVVDNSNDLQTLKSQLETLAQAALQNQALSFSTIMKIYGSASIAEKQRMIEIDEAKRMQQAQEAQQAEQQAQQQLAQAQMEQQQAQMASTEKMATEKNETDILIAQIKTLAAEKAKENVVPDGDGIQEPMTENERETLKEKIREFNENLKIQKEKLDIDREKVAVSRLKKSTSNK